MTLDELFSFVDRDLVHAKLFSRFWSPAEDELEEITRRHEAEAEAGQEDEEEDGEGDNPSIMAVRMLRAEQSTVAAAEAAAALPELIALGCWLAAQLSPPKVSPERPQTTFGVLPGAIKRGEPFKVEKLNKFLGGQCVPLSFCSQSPVC